MVTATKSKRKPATKKAKAETLPIIHGIKGFNRDLSCRGHKFEVGQTYTVDGAIKACQNGFHSCPVDADTPPLAVFEYYAPGVSRYCEVTASGKTDRDGTKIASASITIGVEIGVGVMVDRFIKWVMARAKATGETTNSGTCGAASNSGTRGAASNSGTRGAASNSGYSGAASNSGDSGAASNSGYSGAASNSGDYGAASNSGYSGAASNSGDYGAAFSTGYGGKVMSEKDGCSLHCDERNDNFEIISAACGITGRDGLKAGVWYVCRDGKLVEVSV